MKSFLRKTLKFFGITFLMLLILYWFLLSDFNPMFNDKTFQHLKNEVEKSKSLYAKLVENPAVILGNGCLSNIFLSPY